MTKWIALLALGFLLAACASLTSSPRTSTVAWTQFGLGDSPPLIARALIGPGDACPAISIDGQTAAMAERKSPRAAIFGRLCETRLTLDKPHRVRISTGNATLLDQEVSRAPQSIAVFGDTGCRVTHYYDQGCGDPAKWPFAQLTASVAAKRPGLILHVGDYYYREAPCLRSSTDCVPGPYGDREETWRAEFFTPAAPLLAAAPWIFVRGNHEDCARGGYGWTYYFSDAEQACQIVHVPTRISLAGFDLLDIDSAHADDQYARDEINTYWAGIAAALRQHPPAGTTPFFVITHEPAFGICPDGCLKDQVADVGGIRTIAETVRASGRRTVVMTGHIHAFEAIDAAGITQMIIGTGGSSLDQFGISPDPLHVTREVFEDWRREKSGEDWLVVARGRVPMRAEVGDTFGFGMLSLPSLELTMYDVAGTRQFACALADEATAPRCR
jgi:Calcineurin-like phosphoesterase